MFKSPDILVLLHNTIRVAAIVRQFELPKA
jgi:hypothetical protein